jgi:hypothetical protein
MKTRATVSFDSLFEAFEYASFGQAAEHMAYLCTETGEVLCHSEYGNSDDPLPDDIEDPEKYIALPHKNDLGLGKPLALKFAAEFMPARQSMIRDIFSRPGAYARLKELLEQCGLMKQWHQYEEGASKETLRAWCANNGIKTDG